MIFGHEHDHDMLIRSHHGPAPLWAKVTCAISMVLVTVLLVQPWRLW